MKWEERFDVNEENEYERNEMEVLSHDRVHTIDSISLDVRRSVLLAK